MTGIDISGPAIGMVRSDSGKTTQPSANAGPSPIRRPIRDATTAPISPPTAPTPSARPSAPGETPSVSGDVQDEQRPEREGEQVDRRDREHRRADDRVAQDERDPRHETPADRPRLGLDRRLGRPDPAQEDDRSEERQGVGQHRQRRPEDLDQEPADRRARDVGDRAAAVQQRHRLDVSLATRHRHEDRVPRQVEHDRQATRPGSRRRTAGASTASRVRTRPGCWR